MPTPFYLDRHDLESVTAEQVAQAHLLDLSVQEKYGVRYVTYWFDPARRSAFCLVEAANAESAKRVHREAHGLMPNYIIDVDPRRVEEFLGKIAEPAPGEPWAESALRTILFTDMEGSTDLTRVLGDEKAMEVLREHDKIIGEMVDLHGGRKIKHTGDGVMACYSSVVRALESAISIQRGLAARDHPEAGPNRVRIGLSAGEPVTENSDLFGTAVQLAARVCAKCEPGAILAPSTVKDLSMGKGFDWQDRGPASLKGFDEPIRLYELQW